MHGPNRTGNNSDGEENNISRGEKLPDEPKRDPGHDVFLRNGDRPYLSEGAGCFVLLRVFRVGHHVWFGANSGYSSY